MSQNVRRISRLAKAPAKQLNSERARQSIRANLMPLVSFTCLIYNLVKTD